MKPGLERLLPMVALLLAALGVSVAILELGSRTFLGERLRHVARNAESFFWQADVELGWSRVPHATGEFSNGYFRARVHLAETGVRLNAAADTRIRGYRNLLLIGDSTTASLEVDDDETVAARLEARLRERGQRVNAVNLGVRGYSTGQAVGAALRYAEQHEVARVVYQYTDNDIFNNNTLKRPARAFGKPALMRSAGSAEFQWQSPPDAEASWDDGSLIVLDENCEPFIYRAHIDTHQNPFETIFSERGWARLKSALYVARLAEFAEQYLRYWAYGEGDFWWTVTEIHEPYLRAAQHPNRWFADFEDAHYDGQDLRARCHDYFTDQMAAHLSRLRAIPSLQRVDVVEFPSPSTRAAAVAAGLEDIPTLRMFEQLKQRGVIDSFQSLTASLLEQHKDITELQCETDPHFCEAGNLWLAEQMLAGLEWD
jgi:hypothetical protein